MPELNGKIYKDIRVNSQYVIQLTAEHIREYLELKNVTFPCELRVGIHDQDGIYSDLDPQNPIVVTCVNYEQSTTETDF